LFEAELPRQLRAADEHATRTTPEIRLAEAVLRTALIDLRNHRPGIRLWFTSPLSTLDFWCSVLDLDADIVRSRAVEAARRTGRPRHGKKAKGEGF